MVSVHRLQRYELALVGIGQSKTTVDPIMPNERAQVHGRETNVATVVRDGLGETDPDTSTPTRLETGADGTQRCASGNWAKVRPATANTG